MLQSSPVFIVLQPVAEFLSQVLVVIYYVGLQF